jgi:peptidoglycan/xylan/chitin deacetylase (PgdA/CDA1 family)
MPEPLGHLFRRKAVEAGVLPIGGAGKARVLMYHGIGDRGCDRVNVRHIGVDRFAHHLRIFKEHFHVVDLRTLLAGERHPKRLTIALTFDDGFRNNLTKAVPLLEEHEVPATFFITGANPAGLRCLWGDLADLAAKVTSGPIMIAGERFTARKERFVSDQDGTLLNDRIKWLGTFGPKQELYAQLGPLLDGPLASFAPFWQLLSDDDLRLVARNRSITIGSHGWFHNEMGRLPLADAVNELERSRSYLTSITGQTIDLMAWPSGSYSSEGVRAAMEMGLTHQFAVDLLNKNDHRRLPMLLPRYGVYDFPVSDRWLLHLIARGAHA